MFCTRCGGPLPDGAAFCPGCGTPSATLPPASASPSAPPETGAAGVAAVAAPRYGGFWRRVLAFIIDGFLIGIVMTPLGLGLGLAQLGLALHDEPSVEAIAALLMTSLLVWFFRILVSWAYGAGFESSRWQATPGKMVVGLQVTDLEGRRITFLRATGRALGKCLSGFLLGIGYLLVAFHDRKQGLHDLLAGTLVRHRSAA